MRARSSHSRTISDDLVYQHGSSTLQTLILIVTLGLGGVAAVNALRGDMAEKSQCVGVAIANLGAPGGRCAQVALDGLPTGPLPPEPRADLGPPRVRRTLAFLDGSAIADFGSSRRAAARQQKEGKAKGEGVNVEGSLDATESRLDKRFGDGVRDTRKDGASGGVSGKVQEDVLENGAKKDSLFTSENGRVTFGTFDRSLEGGGEVSKDGIKVNGGTGFTATGLEFDNSAREGDFEAKATIGQVGANRNVSTHLRQRAHEFYVATASPLLAGGGGLAKAVCSSATATATTSTTTGLISTISGGRPATATTSTTTGLISTISGGRRTRGGPLGNRSGCAAYAASSATCRIAATAATRPSRPRPA